MASSNFGRKISSLIPFALKFGRAKDNKVLRNSYILVTYKAKDEESKMKANDTLYDSYNYVVDTNSILAYYDNLIDSTYTYLSNNVEEMKSSINLMQNTVNRVNGQYSVLDNKVDKLNTAYAYIDKSLTELYTNESVLSSYTYEKIGDILKRNEDADKNIDTLNNDSSYMKEYLDSLRNDLKDLDDNIKENTIKIDESAISGIDKDTTVQLHLNSDNVVSIVTRAPLKILSRTPNPDQYREIDSNISNTDVVLKVVTNNIIDKDSVTWDTISGNVQKRQPYNTVDNSTECRLSFQEPKSGYAYRLKCTLKDIYNNSISTEFSLRYTNKKRYIGYSIKDSVNLTSSNNGFDIGNDLSVIKSDCTKLSGTTYDSTNLKDPIYWYYITPEELDEGNFYFGSGTKETKNSGGFLYTGKTITQYSTKETYYIWRSKYPQKDKMNLVIK